MTYAKRLDGRKFDELRPMTAKVGIIKNAVGSALFQMGKTIALAAVYGPRELHPRFKQNPSKGVLRVYYSMLPFSSKGERIRPGQNRRAKEISMVIEKALLPVVNLDKFPNAVVDVFIVFPQTDAGTRCAGINAASLALADAGIEMEDLVSSVAVGRVDDKIVSDLIYDEEAYPEGGVADIPIAMKSNTGQVTLLQMDGNLTRDQLKKALEMAKKCCSEITEVQKKALKARFSGEKK